MLSEWQLLHLECTRQNLAEWHFCKCQNFLHNSQGIPHFCSTGCLASRAFSPFPPSLNLFAVLCCSFGNWLPGTILDSDFSLNIIPYAHSDNTFIIHLTSPGCLMIALVFHHILCSAFHLTVTCLMIAQVFQRILCSTLHLMITWHLMIALEFHRSTVLVGDYFPEQASPSLGLTFCPTKESDL